MKNLNEYINEGEKYIKGLHQAEVGDYISIGFQGNRNRHVSKITKILDTNRLVDSDGNIFGRNGVIERRKGGWAKITPKGNIVSAKIITQTEFDKQYKEIKVNFIKDKIADQDIEIIEKIIDMFVGWAQANTKNISRFD